MYSERSTPRYEPDSDRYGYGDPIRGYPTVSTIGGWYVLVVQGGATQLNVTPARALKSLMYDEARAVMCLEFANSQGVRRRCDKTVN